MKKRSMVSALRAQLMWREAEASVALDDMNGVHTCSSKCTCHKTLCACGHSRASHGTDNDRRGACNGRNCPCKAFTLGA